MSLFPPATGTTSTSVRFASFGGPSARLSPGLASKRASKRERIDPRKQLRSQVWTNHRPMAMRGGLIVLSLRRVMPTSPGRERAAPHSRLRAAIGKRIRWLFATLLALELGYVVGGDLFLTDALTRVT